MASAWDADPPIESITRTSPLISGPFAPQPPFFPRRDGHHLHLRAGTETTETANNLLLAFQASCAAAFVLERLRARCMDHSAAGPIGPRRAGAALSYGPSEGDRLARLGLSESGKPGVSRLNDDRSLSDSGGDPFHGARADVTDSEDPGPAGLKEGAGRRGIGVVSCQDETTVVQPHGVFDPSGAGVGTDHDE